MADDIVSFMEHHSAYPDIAALLVGDKPALRSIPRFPQGSYEVHVPWTDLERTIAYHVKDNGLNIDPDFQRGHVWTPAQRTAYVEYCLMGGEVSKTLVFGADEWASSEMPKRYELLDGKQRMESVRAFLRGEVRAFGRKLDEFSGKLRSIDYSFNWRVVEVKTKADALKLYLALNSGGTPHSPVEIGRVQRMLAAELAR